MRLLPVRQDGSVSTERVLGPETLQVCRMLCDHYARSGYEEPWVGYLAEEEGEIVGTCAFKSAPQAGRVEIAYYTFAPYEGRGYATRMARQLVAMALERDPALTLTAHTLPAQSASTVILVRLGFMKAGESRDPDDGIVWSWELRSAPPRLAGE